MAALAPPSMYLFMAVVAQADQLSLALVCCWIHVVSGQCQLWSVLQMVDVMDSISSTISVIFIPANNTLIFIRCQDFLPHSQPLTPRVEDVRICNYTVLDIFFFFFCHKNNYLKNNYQIKNSQENKYAPDGAHLFSLRKATVDSRLDILELFHQYHNNTFVVTNVSPSFIFLLSQQPQGIAPVFRKYFFHFFSLFAKCSYRIPEYLFRKISQII